MAIYDNTNRGAIWGNKKKVTDTHPDFTGGLNIEGVEYWVSAWKRKESDHINAPALSISVKIKEQQQNKTEIRGASQIREPNDLNFDDDIPF